MSGFKNPLGRMVGDHKANTARKPTCLAITIRTQREGRLDFYSDNARRSTGWQQRPHAMALYTLGAMPERGSPSGTKRRCVILASRPRPLSFG
jgi:hypothetical protein